jgi:hypothetical protein
MAIAEKDWRRHIANNLKNFDAVFGSGPRPGGGTLGATFEDLTSAGNIVIGSPATVVESITRFYRTVGGFGTFLIVGGRDIGTRDQRDDMFSLFMEAVAPKLTNLDATLDEAPSLTVPA